MFTASRITWLVTAASAALIALTPSMSTADPQIRPGIKLPERNPGEDAQVEELPKQIEGFTEPYRDINMAAAEMGTLARIEVKDGDIVRAGQILATLDVGVLEASLEVARAGMNALGELQTSQTQLGLKKVELTKLTELFGRKHASQQELDRVNGEVRVATSRLQSVREDIDVRRLEFARIEAQIRQRQIRSTINGVVVDVRKDQGEYVSPSDPVVARVVQLDPLLVVFAVPLERRSEISNGRDVKLRVGLGEQSATGRVEFVSPVADASSGTFRVKVRIANGDNRWSSGEKTILVLDETTPEIRPADHVAKNSK